ncbi:Uncharacterized protein GBIM_00251 [Gryllus bimaculatus]|nr:Uncharacterized protein GBIM_00251 [Gryllus bimaculatus]
MSARTAMRRLQDSVRTSLLLKSGIDVVLYGVIHNMNSNSDSKRYPIKLRREEAKSGCRSQEVSGLVGVRSEFRDAMPVQANPVEVIAPLQLYECQRLVNRTACVGKAAVREPEIGTPGSDVRCADAVRQRGCNMVGHRCKCSEAPVCPGEAPFAFASRDECEMNLAVMLAHEQADASAQDVILLTSNP